MINRARMIFAIAAILTASMLSASVPLAWAAPTVHTPAAAATVLPAPIWPSLFCSPDVTFKFSPRPTAAIVRHGNQTAIWAGKAFQVLILGRLDRSGRMPGAILCRPVIPPRITPL